VCVCVCVCVVFFCFFFILVEGINLNLLADMSRQDRVHCVVKENLIITFNRSLKLHIPFFDMLWVGVSSLQKTIRFPLHIKSVILKKNQKTCGRYLKYTLYNVYIFLKITWKFLARDYVCFFFFSLLNI
jgi:hypothetical protein